MTTPTQHNSLFRRQPALKYGLIALLVVIFDQITKLLVKLNMEPGTGFPILGEFLKIFFIENPGAAFGMTLNSFFPSLTDQTAKLILTVFSLIAISFIAYFLFKVSTYKNRLPFFLALILGGAVGNIIDRVFYAVWFSDINQYVEEGYLYGRVVDMVYFDIWKGYLPEWLPVVGGQYYALWPIFNAADAAISVGIVAILVFQKHYFTDHQPKINEAITNLPATSPETTQPSVITDNNQPSTPLQTNIQDVS